MFLLLAACDLTSPKWELPLEEGDVSITDVEILSGCGELEVLVTTAASEGGSDDLTLFLDGVEVDDGYAYDEETTRLTTDDVPDGEHLVRVELGSGASWESTYTEFPPVDLAAVPFDGPVYEGDTLAAEARVSIPSGQALTARWELGGLPEAEETVEDGGWISWSFTVPSDPSYDVRLELEDTCEETAVATWGGTPLACDDDDGDGYDRCVDDCDDDDHGVHPGADEVCDGADDDCDGSVDEGATQDCSAIDEDGDGVAVGAGDCDDTDQDVHPGAEDVADCRDNDCDGVWDEDGTPSHAFEPNDTSDEAYVLEDVANSSAALFVYASDEADWFRFYAEDNGADWFGIHVTVTPTGPDPGLDLRLFGDPSNVSWMGADQGDGTWYVAAGGDWFQSDSGDYTVEVSPSEGTCGYTLEVESG